MNKRKGCEKTSESEKLAEEHYSFLEKWLHMIFVDGFVHGYKHAKKDADKLS